MAIVRGWTSSEGPIAVREFFALRPPRRAAIRKLMEGVCSSNPTARKRATDIARLISAREPGILSEWTDLLIDVFAELAPDSESPDAEWQSCGYAALAAAHNAVTHAQRMRLALILQPMLNHSRIAVRATALESFCRVAAAEPDLRHEAQAAIEQARLDTTPALRARARAMTALLHQRTPSKPTSSKSTRLQFQQTPAKLSANFGRS